MPSIQPYPGPGIYPPGPGYNCPQFPCPPNRACIPRKPSIRYPCPSPIICPPSGCGGIGRGCGSSCGSGGGGCGYSCGGSGGTGGCCPYTPQPYPLPGPVPRPVPGPIQPYPLPGPVPRPQPGQNCRVCLTNTRRRY